MKTSSIQRAAVVTAAAAAVLFSSYSAMAATVTWTGTTSTDFETGTNWTNPTTPNTPPVNNATTDIGTFNGTVTTNQPSLSKSRSLLGLVFSTAAGGWTLNTGDPAYTLTLGANGIDTTGQTGGTATINPAVLLSNLTTTFNTGTGSTLLFNGAVTAGGASAKLVFGNSSGNASTITLAAGGSIRNAVTNNAGNTLNINGGTFTAGTTSGVVFNNSGTLTVNNGGTVTAGAGIYFYNYGTTTVNTGGTLNSGRSLYASYSGPGSVTLSGGTIASTGANFLGHNTSVGTLNLDSGEFQTASAFTHDSNATGNVINFNGATLKATADIADLILKPTQITANVQGGGAVVDTNGFAVGITSAALVHGAGATDGGLTKHGLGTLTLGAANTYTGNTTVTNGTLIDNNAASGVGMGNVIVAADSAVGAVFQMNAATDLTALQSLTLTDFAGTPNSATANLNYTGTDTIFGLTANGTVYGAGIYGSTAAAGVTQVSFLTGGGTLTVVPEPAMLGLLGLGAACLLRRKSRAAESN